MLEKALVGSTHQLQLGKKLIPVATGGCWLEPCLVRGSTANGCAAARLPGDRVPSVFPVAMQNLGEDTALQAGVLWPTAAWQEF